MEPRSDFFCAIISLSLSHISFLRMVPLCALSPPWWRQCSQWLSSSVAYWWKSSSLDWASLVGCRTPDVLFVRVDEGRRESCKGDETWVILPGQFIISVWFLSDQRSTLELPSSVLPWEALTLLYIGGASSSSSLLSCQETDGANEARMAVQMGRASTWKFNRNTRNIWLEMLRTRYQHRFLNGA